MKELSPNQTFMIHAGQSSENVENNELGYYLKSRGAIGALTGGLIGYNLNLYSSFMGGIVGGVLGMGYGLIEWWIYQPLF